MVKALSYSLVSLGTRLARNRSLVEAENSFLLSLMLGPKNKVNPSHFCLAVLYALINRNQEAQSEAKLALQMFDHFLTEIDSIEEKYPPFNIDLSDRMLIMLGLERMLRDIVSYGILSSEAKNSDLFKRADFVIMVSILSDPDMDTIRDRLFS